MAETDSHTSGEGPRRDHRPKLTIVIGTNGAGKSTWCSKHEDELPAAFYDADSIANSLGDWNDPRDQIQAARRVNGAIRDHLARRESFGFESTYSGRSRPRMVERAARAGYDVHAVFIGTRDAEINVIRVQKRVTENTGHAVDADDIRRRWHNAQENLARTAHAFTRIDLYDNSGTTYRQIAVLKRHAIEQVSPETPEWTRLLLGRIGNLPGPGLSVRTGDDPT
jgi:predicted ABC-type ATPase